jgi:hypothetical protein
MGIPRSDRDQRVDRGHGRWFRADGHRQPQAVGAFLPDIVPVKNTDGLLLFDNIRHIASKDGITAELHGVPPQGLCRNFIQRVGGY